jgi:tRNA (guanine-N7-)-methyltransferase
MNKKKLTFRGVPREERGPIEVLPGGGRNLKDWHLLFGREAELRVEVGPGKGDWLREMAGRHPEVNWVAIEVKRPRAVWIEEKMLRAGLTNVRVMCADAIRELPVAFPPGSLAALHVNFFDPWPKDRHARRRFAQYATTNAVAQLLRVGGALFFVTDHRQRAEDAREFFNAHPVLEDTWGPKRFTERLPDYPMTIHEKKFRERGREIHFLRYQRRG